jgi:predicted HicB family RNase H-like nuclease
MNNGRYRFSSCRKHEYYRTFLPVTQPPEKPISGKFIVHFPADLHRKAYLQSKLAHKRLKGWITNVLKTNLKDHQSPASE